MATMLAFLASNIKIDKRTLQKALKAAVDPTFNCITVDGETSTNDMVLLLANGQAGNPAVKAGSKAYKDFVTALTHVCKTLAFKIVEDGEGATKFVTFKVSDAKTEKQAQQIGKRLANSLLVKTALFGEDPNWGRIISAVGSAGVPIKPAKLEVVLNGVPLVKNGEHVKGVSSSALQKAMKKKEIEIDIGLHMGKAYAETYTCDLSYDYVRINAEYTT
jgi:glutamate N-acetyltransferase/amino-acid N-acetyltransferase